MSTPGDAEPAKDTNPVVGHPYGGVEKPPPDADLPGEKDMGGDEVPEGMRGRGSQAERQSEYATRAAREPMANASEAEPDVVPAPGASGGSRPEDTEIAGEAGSASPGPIEQLADRRSEPSDDEA
jgi:hypothetical protein